MEVILTVPDDLGHALGADQRQVTTRVQLDLAVQCYREGLVSLGRAAETAGRRRGEFEQVLSERGVTRTDRLKDLDSDLR